MSEGCSLPGLHISWLVIPQTSPGRTNCPVHWHSTDVNMGSHSSQGFPPSSLSFWLHSFPQPYEGRYLPGEREGIYSCLQKLEASVLYKCFPSFWYSSSIPHSRGLEGLSSWVLNSTEGMLSYFVHSPQQPGEKRGISACQHTPLGPFCGHFLI